MTYNSGQPIPLDKQVYKTSTPYVGELDGRVVGTFVVMDMTCTRGSQAAWKTGGIAGVAVLPEARQSGVGGAMMRWALKHMRESGYVLAALYAFRESYYRQFGYEVCGMRYRIPCPNARLPRHKAALPIRRVPAEGLDEIKACHEGFCRARSGMNLRNEMHWGRVVNENRAIYAAGDPVEAYAIVDHDWTFWIDQPVAEFGWTTERGYESMVSFFGSLGINKTSVSWNEPSDSPFLARHLDKGIDVVSEKPIMFRLLNAPAALSDLKGAEGSFHVALHDQDLPENAGPWLVECRDGKTRVTPAESFDFELDVRAGVQALLGEPGFDALMRNGVAPVNEAARRLLPPIPVYHLEHF
jgi:predicted acetyltransferase